MQEYTKPSYPYCRTSVHVLQASKYLHSRSLYTEMLGRFLPLLLVVCTTTVRSTTVDSFTEIVSTLISNEADDTDSQAGNTTVIDALREVCMQPCDVYVGEACNLLSQIMERGWNGRAFPRDRLLHILPKTADYIRNYRPDVYQSISAATNPPAKRLPYRVSGVPFAELPYAPSAVRRFMSTVSSAMESVSTTLMLPFASTPGQGIDGVKHEVRDDLNMIVQPDIPAALQYADKGAQCGNPSAHFTLGVLHAFGVAGYPKSEGKALLHYYTAALGGDVDAMSTLAYRFDEGIGVTASCAGSSQYYEAAARAVVERLEPSYGLLFVAPPPTVYSLDHETLETLHNSWRQHPFDSVSLAYYHNLADKGDLNAHVVLGHLYLIGVDAVPQDFALASEHFHAAAEHAETASQVGLAYMYIHGFGVEQDFVIANELLKEPLAVQVAAARNLHGYMALHGLGQPQDVVTAYEYFSEAAAGGCIDAFYNLGLMALNGTNPTGRRDFNIARHHFAAAASRGHLLAAFRLAVMQLHGIGDHADCEGAVRAFKEVLQHGKHVDTALMGISALARKNHGAALLEFLRASEQGIESSQWNAVYLLEMGLVEPSLLSNAADGTHEEQQQQDAAAKNHTSDIMSALVSLAHDPGVNARKLALRLLQRSAQHGNGRSHLLLGHYMLQGLGGLPPSHQQASAEFTKACMQQVPQACFVLGVLAEYGGFGTPDDHIAKRYYDLTLQHEAKRPFFNPARIMLWRLNARQELLDKVLPYLQQWGLEWLPYSTPFRQLLGLPEMSPPAPTITTTASEQQAASPAAAAAESQEKAEQPSSDQANQQQRGSGPATPEDAQAKLMKAFEAVKERRLQRRQAEDVFVHAARHFPDAALNGVANTVHWLGQMLGMQSLRRLNAEECVVLLCLVLLMVILVVKARRRRRVVVIPAAAQPRQQPPPR